MAFPVAITTVTVSASFYNPSGGLTGVSGTVKFTPSLYRISGAQDVMAPQIPVEVAVVDGVMTPAVLAATDDADLPPTTNMYYTVTEKINGAPDRTYKIQLPLAVTAVNLADVTPLP